MNLDRMIRKRDVRGLAAVLGDPSRPSWARERAADALGTIGGPAAFEALARALDQAGMAGPTLRNLVRLRDDPRLFDLLAGLARAPGYHPAKAAAIESLAAFGRAAVPVLAGLHTSEPAVSRALEAIGGEPAVDALIARIEQPQLGGVEWAMGALAHLRERRAVEPLTRLLADQEHWAAASTALVDLGLSVAETDRLREEQLLARWLPVLGTGGPEEERSAIGELRHLQWAAKLPGSATAVRDALVDRLRDGDADVRAAAVDAMLGQEDAPLPAMLRSLAQCDELDAGTAFSVVRQMRRAPRPEYLPLLLPVVEADSEPWKSWWEHDAAAYARWCEESKGYEFRTRQYDLVDVRAEAIAALGALGDRSAAPALRRLLSERWLAEYADAALRALGETAAVDAGSGT